MSLHTRTGAGASGLPYEGWGLVLWLIELGVQGLIALCLIQITMLLAQFVDWFAVFE